MCMIRIWHAKFELLAWEDPSGPGAPFWRQDGMPEALLNPDASPLAAIPDEGGTVYGLRLLSGDLGRGGNRRALDHRRMDALAGPALDREGAGARRRRMAEPRAVLSGARAMRRTACGIWRIRRNSPGFAVAEPGSDSSRNRAIRAFALPAGRITHSAVPLSGMRGTGGMVVPGRIDN